MESFLVLMSIPPFTVSVHSYSSLLFPYRPHYWLVQIFNFLFEVKAANTQNGWRGNEELCRVVHAKYSQMILTLTSLSLPASLPPFLPPSLPPSCSTTTLSLKPYWTIRWELSL